MRALTLTLRSSLGLWIVSTALAYRRDLAQHPTLSISLFDDAKRSAIVGFICLVRYYVSYFRSLGYLWHIVTHDMQSDGLPPRIQCHEISANKHAITTPRDA